MTCWASQAADQHAFDEDQAERHAEFVATFAQDAADEVLCTEGNAAYFVNESIALETLFLQVLWADKDSAFAKVCALRDALRETVAKRYPSDVQKAAQRLANEQLDAETDAALTARVFARLESAGMPAFPGVRGGL